MRRKQLPFVLNEVERQALDRLAQQEGRSLGDTLRLLIRDAATARGLWPTQETNFQ